MRKTFFLIVLSLMLAVPARAEDGFAEVGKQIGRGFKRMTHESGRAFKEWDRGRPGFKEIGRETAQRAKETGSNVGPWFRDAGRKTGGAFQEMGQSIKRFFGGDRT